ncbi:phosphatidylserine decarboxylase family protein [Roseivirga misakiensis]|uniref:Phosphatidylserine decarboxylase proenzyme n=1 Tax=Roseivirga misakiensis TaxID=1563681 RepID=A0A1E5T3Q0_9BACT|nr:phosphatidylserine decarboxylase family protein [Roseivirga misakiensis]OEK05976.1 phosphatidylserine decarboxylase [Roseivirga misakiensis]
MKIHKEGRVLLLVLFLVLIASLTGLLYLVEVSQEVFWAVIGFESLVFLFFLQFFRNPKRKTVLNDKLVIAPADGKVVVVENTPENEYFKGEERIQVSIFMSPLNVHVNRNPVTGLIKYFKYHPGKYLFAWHPKSSTENERTSVVYEIHKGVEILVRQIAGAAARRIKWYIDENQSVIQGKEFGFIKFGSRVDLFLPVGTKINVQKGQKTVGGQTVIAELD